MRAPLHLRPTGTFAAHSVQGQYPSPSAPPRGPNDWVVDAHAGPTCTSRFSARRTMCDARRVIKSTLTLALRVRPRGEKRGMSEHGRGYLSRLDKFEKARGMHCGFGRTRGLSSAHARAASKRKGRCLAASEAQVRPRKSPVRHIERSRSPALPVVRLLTSTSSPHAWGPPLIHMISPIHQF